MYAFFPVAYQSLHVVLVLIGNFFFFFFFFFGDMNKKSLTLQSIKFNVTKRGVISLKHDFHLSPHAVAGNTEEAL